MEEQECYFPMFVNLCGREILVFGGGKIATRRVTTLLTFQGRVQVVAPLLTEALIQMQESGRIEVALRRYREGEIKAPFFVLAATDDSAVNEAIYRECRQKHIPVNVASDLRKCDFYFPGVAVKGSLVAGVTASGKDHKKAKWAAKRIQDMLEQDVQ